MTFKDYLIEKLQSNINKSIDLDIILSDHNDDTITTEVEISVTYDMVASGQGYDHEKESYEIDPESIEYNVEKQFEYKGKTYKIGSDLRTLYSDVFVDDKYKNKSKDLSKNVTNYFIKDNLSNTDKEETFFDLIITMITG